MVRCMVTTRLEGAPQLWGCNSQTKPSSGLKVEHQDQNIPEKPARVVAAPVKFKKTLHLGGSG